MSLIADGRAALTAMLQNPDLFTRLKPADFSSFAIKLAKKQIIAGGLTREDQLALREALGEDIYEKTLDSLTATQAKQLAKRIDKNATPAQVKTGAIALAHARAILANKPTDATETKPNAEAAPARKNKYVGRKSFRTGR